MERNIGLALSGGGFRATLFGLGGLLNPFKSISETVAGIYDRELFKGFKLSGIPSSPEAPEFVFYAANLQTGVSVRITKTHLADYRLGKIDRHGLSLADAVTASSAFPPFLSPFVKRFKAGDWSAYGPAYGSGKPDASESPELWGSKPLHARVELTDGGVYDNMGLENVWNDKGIDTILVSDAGAPMRTEDHVPGIWPLLLLRSFGIVQEQARAVRKRWLIDKMQRKEIKGAYWGLKTEIAGYGLTDPLMADSPETAALSKMRTRLNAFSDVEQRNLIQWGYALADAAIRKWVAPETPKGALPP
jgi:NTE family protein